ncbi:hypothetical protein [Bradyrhizobium diazoefficiens]|uniref:hypothetical protein n=1 Tax=Bradyrhizobium diazoefficiens TaxID=1355477 RepID=UPI00346D53FF
MAISSALVSTASNSSGGEIRPRGLQHRVAIRREFAANHVEHLGLQLVQGIEQPVLAGREHAHELPVARQQRTLAILHRHVQHQQVPSHGTPPSFAPGRMPDNRLRLQRT